MMHAANVSGTAGAVGSPPAFRRSATRACGGILFVNGQEKKRWFSDFGADSYRKVLNEYVGGPAPRDSGPKDSAVDKSTPKR
jgi:hypothetical protein